MGALGVIVSLLKVGSVFVLLAITLKLLGRARGIRGDVSSTLPGPTVELVDKTRVGRTGAVVTMRVGDRMLLLGVTETQITTLADVTDAMPDPPEVDDVDVTDDGGRSDRVSVLDHAVEVLRANFSNRPG